MAGIPKTFQKFHQAGPELQRLQKNIEDSFGQLVKNPLLDGRLVQTSVVSGANKIEHKLARAINGYLVVKQNANITIYDSADDSIFLTLIASGSADISLWIF